MAVTRESPFASRSSRIVLGVTVAFGLCAAVAAAPTAPTLKGQSSSAVKAAVSLNDDGLRPLARGPAIKVGRAYCDRSRVDRRSRWDAPMAPRTKTARSF
ncbi:hypothetical protein OGR47_18825 [Methylocystis sp. MJC1]|uniref:hypothetical protein n=1 Tax=Methylocystis sp. MJC1 TaxID=2654282 RepID=UPI0020A6B2C9|nr:hypothetical protein [Methylocystis sp. MJC1]UZX11892.1 hypothetical protein OGR47_18825 [Methylocystis sp. MJC1]